MKNAAPEVAVELGRTGFSEVRRKRGSSQEVYKVLLPFPARGFASAFFELLQCLNQKTVQCEHSKSGEILLVASAASTNLAFRRSFRTRTAVRQSDGVERLSIFQLLTL
jgi:hypothetical protein